MMFLLFIIIIILFILYSFIAVEIINDNHPLLGLFNIDSILNIEKEYFEKDGHSFIGS